MNIKLTQKEIENLNKLITNKEIEFIKIFSNMQSM